MSTVLLRLARVIEVLSAFVLIVGLVVAPLNFSFADDEYAATDCTNGGGGKTSCAVNSAKDGCTVGTAGKQCDHHISCTCISNAAKPCFCGGVK